MLGADRVDERFDVDIEPLARNVATGLRHPLAQGGSRELTTQHVDHLLAEAHSARLCPGASGRIHVVEDVARVQFGHA